MNRTACEPALRIPSPDEVEATIGIFPERQQNELRFLFKGYSEATIPERRAMIETIDDRRNALRQSQMGAGGSGRRGSGGRETKSDFYTP